MFLRKLQLVSLLFTLGLIATGGVIAGSGGAVADPDQPPRKGKVAEGEKALPGAPTVRLIQPQPGGRDPIITGDVSVQASRQADLRPRIAGILKNVLVDIGDRVKAGQILAEIDAPGLVLDTRLASIAVDQAQSLLQDAEARLLMSKAEIEAAKGIVKLRETEMVGSRTKLESHKKLLELAKNAGNAGSLHDLIEAEIQYRTVEAQRDAASVGLDNSKLDLEIKRAKSTQCEAGIATAKTNVEAARVGLEKARLLVAQTKLVAPFDGVVTQRTCRTDDYFDPATMRSALFTLMQTEVMRVVVSIPVEHLQTMRVGFPVEVNFPALLSGGPIDGKLARVGVEIDPMSNSVRGEIDVPNPNGDIRPGLFAVARLKRGDILKIPVGSLIDAPLGWGGMQARVYVYQDGKARLTTVRVGANDGKEATILAGLKAGDKVVANPKHLMGNEIEVEVERPAPPK
jgi:RND family efflux transporter MFP subunit